MNDARSIGGQLQAARERMGLDVAEAAEALRVDITVIEALEAGQFASLGAPVFVRGHLRHYAQLLGEPLEELTGRYATLHESSVSPDLANLPHPATGQTGKPPARWPLVVAAIVLILVAVIWWALRVKPA
jgi:cytoskeleton protein RodZ